ncbi:MAG TPA: hypothetical protein VFC25_13645 [Verrucomicrobiae bacterium]|nr:hypothetical protein [Verrucomicrobiae bacterium]
MPALEGRTFRRSLSTRAVSVVALLTFGLAFASRATGEIGFGWVVLAALTLASLAGVISAWGDRIVIDSGGVTIRNGAFTRMTGGLVRVGARRIEWQDIVRVQEHRRLGSGPADPPRALFLVTTQGKRFALDAIEDFDEVIALVRRAREAADRPGQ